MSSPRRLRVSPQVTHQTIEGEVIAIHFGNGAYHSMRGSAAAIWERIAQEDPAALEPGHFQGTPPDAGAKLAAFAAALATAGLVEEADGTSRPVANGKSPLQWSEPALETFTDLSGLLLADPIHDVNSEGWPTLEQKPGQGSGLS